MNQIKEKKELYFQARKKRNTSFVVMFIAIIISIICFVKGALNLEYLTLYMILGLLICFGGTILYFVLNINCNKCEGSLAQTIVTSELTKDEIIDMAKNYKINNKTIKLYLDIYKNCINNKESNLSNKEVDINLDTQKEIAKNIESDMSKFKYNDEFEQYLMSFDGINVVCDELFEGCEEIAESLAVIYPEKIDDIVEYIKDRVSSFFDINDSEIIKKSLGKPTIDIERGVIMYLEHTLDDDHIIEIDYDGQLDDFSDISING